MALKDITTIEETEQLSADATFYTADGGAFRRAGMDAVKDALGLALESTATKEALLNCFQHVAWIDEHGQDYYDALYDALYNIPVSITATFVQGSNVIYNTDPLSTLRQYLIVRATYEDETVQTVTAYTLSGTLTVGTSTITVAYKGRTATFEVTVTQTEAYITAVLNLGTHQVYEGDPIDSLKEYLTVTYYQNQSATGEQVPADDYTLSGSITEGTQPIIVTYGVLSTTFNVVVTNPYIYRLTNTPVTLDGTEGIDTGVQLLSQNQSFTMAVEFIDNRPYDTAPVQGYLFGCYLPASPYTGIFMQVYDGGASGDTNRKIRHVLRCTPPGTNGGQIIFDSITPNSELVGRVVRFCFKYDSVSGTVNAMLSVNGVAGTPSVSSFTYTYTAISSDLIVGARMGASEMGNPMLGVYNEFKVYDTVWTDAEMQSYIEGA